MLAPSSGDSIEAMAIQQATGLPEGRSNQRPGGIAERRAGRTAKPSAATLIPPPPGETVSAVVSRSFLLLLVPCLVLCLLCVGVVQATATHAYEATHGPADSS